MGVSSAGLRRYSRMYISIVVARVLLYMGLVDGEWVGCGIGMRALLVSDDV